MRAGVGLPVAVFCPLVGFAWQNHNMSDVNPNPSQQSSTGRTVVVAIAAIATILALVSAFAWPGWALRKSDTAARTVQAQSSSPSVSASSLPANASALLNALPNDVGDFARQGITSTQNWAGSGPIEEYTVVYSNGDSSKDVTLVLAQWESSDDAAGMYAELRNALSGQVQARGNVKVANSTTGKYVVVTEGDGDPTDTTQAEALWRNDTVIFQASGVYASVNQFYAGFPL